MARSSQRDDQTITTELWSVVGVCEDVTFFHHARTACERMAKESKANVEFRFKWWMFDDLVNPVKKLAAVRAAALADMIIFAARPEGDLPEVVRSWVDEWLCERGGREGTLVGLFSEHGLRAVTPLGSYLRQIACRGQMDFMCALPPVLPAKIPDNFDWVTQRAKQITSVLDEILRRSSFPSLGRF